MTIDQLTLALPELMREFQELGIVADEIEIVGDDGTAFARIMPRELSDALQGITEGDDDEDRSDAELLEQVKRQLGWV